MSDPYTPQPAWAMDPYAQPVTGPPAPPPPPSRTPWIIGAAVVAVVLLAGVSVLLFAVGAFDARDTGGTPTTEAGPTKEQPADGTTENTDPGGGGTYVFADDVCATLDFSGYQALGTLAGSYEDRSADYGASATLGCDMDFGDGGELRVQGMLDTADKTVDNWDFAKALLRNRTQEPAAGAWEEGIVGIDESWGPGKTDAILAVRDGTLVVTVAFYSINDGVGYEKVKSLLPATATAVLTAAKG